MAFTVDDHMRKLLVESLKGSNILKEGGRILGSTGSRAKRHKCSTAIRLMSCLSSQENGATDRAIGAPGHGKCGVGKNAIHGEATKTSNNRHLGRAGKSETFQLQTFTANNVRGERKLSTALSCKRVVESKGAEGVKSEGKCAKREREKSAGDTGV